jgi:hypothetical protein
MQRWLVSENDRNGKNEVIVVNAGRIYSLENSRVRNE